MLAVTDQQSWLVSALEWLGVDVDKLAQDGELGLEWVLMPGSGAGIAVMLIVLVAAYAVVHLWRKTLDLWSVRGKVLLVLGSVAVYCLLSWTLLGDKQVMEVWDSGWTDWAGDQTSPSLLYGLNYLSTMARSPAIYFAGILGAAFWVPWIYRWEVDTCSRRARMGLALARIGVLLLLAMILLSPEITVQTTKLVPRVLLLLRDKSQSMDFHDAYRNDDEAKTTAAALNVSTDDLKEKKPSRASVLDQILAAEDYKFLRELAERGKLLVVDFDETLAKPVDPAAGAEKSATDVTPVSHGGEGEAPRVFKLDPLVADGRGSDLYLAINEPLASLDPATMILFTDGQHNGKQAAQEAALRAKQQNVKLYIVGMGDSSRPKDLRVDGVYAQPNVGTKDKFQIETALMAQDIDPQTVTLQLVEQKLNPSDGSLAQEKVIGTKDVLIDKPALPDIRFEHHQTEPGKYVYSVRVAPLDEESDIENNRASSTPVSVLQKDNLKVLLVAGAPTWEYRLVQKLLTRDENIQLSCWLQSLDEERAQDGDPAVRIKELPRLLTATRDVPGLNDYGVILLFDPNPMEFDQEWIETLKKYVSEHAGGVLYMAGPKFTGPFLSNSRTKDIADVVPVRFGDVGQVEVQTLMTLNNQAYPLRVVPANAEHPILKFEGLDTAESMRRWEGLPGVFWTFPSSGPKPTAQVLLEFGDTRLRTSEGARPLLVTGRYGAGNTAYIGFNGTWRWRQIGREAEFFDSFWEKTVRYLADARSSTGRRYGWLETDKDRYEVGEKVRITARLRDASYDDLMVDKVEATLQTDEGAPISISLKAVNGEKGKYEGQIAARRTGVHTLSVEIPASQGVQPTVDDKSFGVDLPRVEMNQQWLNKPLLVELATSTGGEYFELNELDKLADAIPSHIEEVRQPGPPTPLWDVEMWSAITMRQLLLGLLVGLLSVEWAARKALKLL